LDAIQLIKKDHATVERLFKRFERADDREKHAEMKRIVRKVVKELSVHAAIEEQALYPALRRAEEGAEDEVLEALEEHHLVKLTLLEIDKMSPKDERYGAKMSVLIENVRHHVDEEEHEVLPRLRRALSREELRDLGSTLAVLKRAAPTRPHPGAPDTPPGNYLAGAMASVYDRSRDAVRTLADRGAARRGDAVKRGRSAASDVARGARKQVRGAVARARGTMRRVRAQGSEHQPTMH
jgi:hemerythrin-like domain-containing protein